MFATPKSNLNNSSYHSNAALQFEAWTKEKEAFMQAASQHDRERARIEGEIQKLRATDKEACCQHRVIKDELGSLHKENSMLDEDAMRLESIRHAERAELEQSATLSDELLQKEHHSKREYTRLAGGLNKELFSIYNQQQDEHLRELILVETMVTLRETNKLSAAGSKGSQTESDLNDAINQLSKAEESLLKELLEKSKSKDEVKRLRAMAYDVAASVSGSLASSHTDAVEEMERIWAQSCGGVENIDLPQKIETASLPSSNVQLFYSMSSGHGCVPEVE